jgi:DNA/RNA endonuclease YhcR with UshA esterase domain
LGGWQLDDEAEGGSAPYTIPAGQTIPPGGFLVFFKKDSGVSLNNDGDSVRLLRPDGTVADETHYTHSPGYDRSFSRTVDGGGHWTADYAVTLGAPNHPLPPPPAPPGPALATIAETKTMAPEALVTVEGQVTAPPGIFAEESFYMQDSMAGTLVYLREGEIVQPAVALLALGDRVRLTGQVWDYYEEREIRVARPEDIQRLGEGEPLLPVVINTGEMGEAYEGSLVQIVGEITGWDRGTLYLDDGSGQAKVYIKEATGIERPWVEKGELYSVVGIVSQYEEEHELLPRYQSDISLWPGMLPTTGGDSPD